MSPCKSPAGSSSFLHVPSRTTAVLIEAAVRIQKQGTKPKSQGKGLFGSFLKRLKDRSKNKQRAIGDDEFKIFRNYEPQNFEPKQKEITISCSCKESSLSRSDLEACTSSGRPEVLDGVNGDFALAETRLCSSPSSSFRFSLNGSPSSSGRRTPDFCSPVASPRRHVKQDKERDLDSVQGEEEKEQCSPVSVLDPFFEDEAHESEDAEEVDDGDNYDLDSTYANVQSM
ncbi:hypothetical protein CDL12_26881 [Handroanthus impetiginosus]|uniref:Uncharacterized protein n=1 Tax=Handroanthus impetiginosus TaxID=429701 RepID=A0A2G9G5M7_9LAMI|nr:hypothetical protein CDL12_26881 [Handroanthus impetiginosus]